MPVQKHQYILWFKEIDKDDIALVGGKGANLGEMVSFGIPVPDGFVVTAGAYFYFLKTNNLKNQIKKILKTVDVHDPHQLNEVSGAIKKLIVSAKIPHDLAVEIAHAYDKLGGVLSQPLVAVRSSATAEDLPDASFAGQQETFLNISGETNVINNVRKSWASLFTPRAIFYRQEKGFDHFKIGIAVPIQKMLQSEVSGVMFTIDPITNDKTKIIIEAVWGLGETIVQGLVTPDHYRLDSRSFKILDKQINKQEVQLIKAKTVNKQVKVKPSLKNKQKLSDGQIEKLARLGKKIHQHYFFPQDIEWALKNKEIYILQTRPVTTILPNSLSLGKIKKIKSSKLKQKGQKVDLALIVKGDPASPGIGTGYARVIKSAKEIDKVKTGEVLVTTMTTPDFVPAMKKVAAIVTDRGGQTSHAAIVSRELGIPCVVGTDKSTSIIKTGVVLTVNGATGDVYKGGLTMEKNKSFSAFENGEALSSENNHLNIKTATKLYVNLGEPDLAGQIAKRNVDGVGLLRAEFMISEHIKIHPKKLIKDKKESIFIDQLAEGLLQFCQAFDPRPVIYRATDFKTNEYRNLKGGEAFEPEEANPMLGFRGAYRYMVDERSFELELQAIKKVRNKFGYKNLWLMIPFVRTVEEMRQVKKIVASSGLIRSPSFKLWMMVEIPSNVILLEDFLKLGIDGVSVGTNDLTMLILGLDRDNETVADEFDENNEAVLWALERIIKTCLKFQVTSSICGQAPSVYPNLTEKLVKWGINSISVSPDMIEKTRELVYRAEKKLVKTK